MFVFGLTFFSFSSNFIDKNRHRLFSYLPG